VLERNLPGGLVRIWNQSNADRAPPRIRVPRHILAADRGFRVVLVEDGLCSSSDAGHDALMTIYRTRFTEQIELLTIEQVCGLWREVS